MLENVVNYNPLNKTGHINYNKGGVKDGVGFQPYSDKNVDNFVLGILLADYLIHKKKLHRSWINKQNNTCYVGEKQARKVQS